MSETVEVTDGYLDSLIEKAAADLEVDEPHFRRAAMFLVIDYYQLFLVRSARMIRTELQGGLGVDALHVLLAAIPGVPDEIKRELNGKHGLRQIRNDLAHKPDWVPKTGLVKRWIERAPEVRKILEEGAHAAKERRESLGGVPLLFADIVAAVDSLEVDPKFRGDNEDGRFFGIDVSRLRELAESEDPHLTADDVLLYHQVRQAISEYQAAEDAYYEGLAEDAQMAQIEAMRDEMAADPGDYYLDPDS